MCFLSHPSSLSSDRMECISVAGWMGSPSSTFMIGSEFQLRCNHRTNVACRFQVDTAGSYGPSASIYDPLHLQEAFALLDQMVNLPDLNDMMSIMRKCRKEKDLGRIKQVHLHMCHHGLEGEEVLGNYLVPMFADCGNMLLAKQAFQRLDDRDEFAWASFIQGFYECEEFHLTLELFETMQVDCVHPSAFILVTLLKSCARLKNSQKGKEVHEEIIKEGFETNIFVGNSLVDMYAKCGLLLEARDVFDELPDPDVVSWTALIGGFAERGLEDEALSFLEEMKSKGFFPSAVTLFCGLKACGSIGALEAGQEIHTDIVNAGLEDNPSVGNTLIDMYAKCGYMPEAQRVFDKLPTKDVVSWTALISGYAELELGSEALKCFEQMKWESVVPDAVAFMSCLKACGGVGDIGKGQELHMKVVEEGFDSSYIVGSALVDMYAKFGLLPEAHKVLHDLPIRDIAPWNALIGGYVEQGLGAEALLCLQSMQKECLSLNPVTVVCSLKGFGIVSDIENGQRLHDQVIRHGMEMNSFVGNSLIYLYAKCGMLTEMKNVFDSLAVQETISCNTMIAGFADHSLGEEALACWKQMQSEGVPANAITFVCSLKACGIIENLKMGLELHMQVVKKGLEEETLVGNTLVDMYFKCDSLAEACEVFESLTIRDAASWNTVIVGYAEQGLGGEALKCLERMQQDELFLNEITYVGSLKAVIHSGLSNEGLALHAQIVKIDLETDLIIGNMLIDMYGKLGKLEEAQDVFDELPAQDVISWSALISGYTEHKLYDTALSCLERLQQEKVCPTALLLTRGLNACGGLKAICKGQDIESHLITLGLEKDAFVGVALVDMYAKCGHIVEAEKTFEMLSEQDVVAWTALIAGYSEHGYFEETLNSLGHMQKTGFTPDAICFLSAIKACVGIGAKDSGQELHADIVKVGLEVSTYIGNSLVDMYAKFGFVVEAQDVFNELGTRDVISWTALITGYADCGLAEAAFQCLKQMQAEGVTPNEIPWNAIILAFSEREDNDDAFAFHTQMQEQGILPDTATYVSIFKACGRTAALEAGRRLHSRLCNLHAIDGNGPIVLTGLIDMYGKCGSMIDAQQAFDATPCEDLVRWNTLISGYARHEKGEIVFGLWKQMNKMGLRSEVTYLSILSLCSHAGLVDKGQTLFETMCQEYGKAIIWKHHSCMVDLFARAGRLDEALHVLDMMPTQPDSVAWSTVLGACWNWGNMELGVQAFDLVSSLDEYVSSAFT